jgi:hypothetical protein
MKTLKTISSIFRRDFTPKALVLPMMLGLSVGVLSAQGYYDDDLYYDASKVKKESKQTKKKQQAADQQGARMYYFDGTSYVPWDSVGCYNAAGSYAPMGYGSGRDVDEYNRRGSLNTVATDSLSLEECEQMSATRMLARFGDSQVAQDALSSEDYNDAYNDIYSAGYLSGYDAGYNAGNDSSVSVNFGFGYPNYYGYYGYYDNGIYPYFTWGYPFYYYPYSYYSYYPYYSWGWDPYWAWSWGWTSPGWWGHGGHGGHLGDGYNAGYRPTSPTAAHRPRSGGNGSSVGGSHNGYASTRPGYRPPSTNGVTPAGTVNGKYGGSASGRNSHFGSFGSYRPSGSSATNQSGSSSSNRSSFGASQSTRTGSSYNSGSSRSSSHSSGSVSSGSRSGGFSGGGSHSSGGGSRSGGGGGGHRGR